jgi:hypothetical protein
MSQLHIYATALQGRDWQTRGYIHMRHALPSNMRLQDEDDDLDEFEDDDLEDDELDEDDEESDDEESDEGGWKV